MKLEPARRERLERAAPYVLFAAVVLAVFSPVFFLGEVLGGHHDRADQIIPIYGAFARAFKQGHVPQWNPYLFCGKSMSGSGMFVFFYPLYWLVFALPESQIPRTTSFVLIVHVVVALVGSFHLFRRLGADRFWATLAALMYVFSASAVLQMATELNFTSFAYPPVILWLVAGQTRGKLVPNALAQTAAYALLLLSSNPQLVIYTLGVCLAYAGYRAVVPQESTGPRWMFDGPRLAASLAAFAGAFAISAARWVPFYFANKSEGGATIEYADFLRMSEAGWSDFVRFVMPEFFGTDGYADFYGHINHFESIGAYVGVAGCALTVYALVLRWNRRTAFYGGWLVFTILLCLGTPLTWLHYVATGRTMLHFTRFAWLAPLPCAALVALEGRAFFASVTRARWLYLAAFGVVSMGAALMAYETQLGFQAKSVIAGQSQQAMVVFGAFFAALLAVAWTARRLGEGSPVFRAALLAVTMIDLAVAFRHEANITLPFFRPMADFAYPTGDVEAARQVSEPSHLYRVMRQPVIRNAKIYSQYTLNDRWITLGAYSSSGYDNGAPRRIIQMYLVPVGPTINRIFERVIWPMTARVAEITSTALVLSDAHPTQTIEHPVPRVKLFARWRAADDVTAVKAMFDPSYDLGASLFVHDPPSFPSVDADATGEVAITDDDFDRVTLAVKAGQPSLVLLNDTYNGGWHVDVDGQPGKVLRANYAFRAVEVPAGEHVVRWSYRQKGMSAGIATSLAGLGAFALAAAFTAVRRRRAIR